MTNTVKLEQQLEAASNRQLELGVLKTLLNSFVEPKNKGLIITKRQTDIQKEFEPLDADCFFYADTQAGFKQLISGQSEDHTQLEELLKNTQASILLPAVLVKMLQDLKQKRIAIELTFEKGDFEQGLAPALPQAAPRQTPVQRPDMGLEASTPHMLYEEMEEEETEAEPARRSHAPDDVPLFPTQLNQEWMELPEPLKSITDARETLIEAYLEKQDRQAQNGYTGLITHMPRLNEVMGGLQPGGYILAGAPSSGKTSFARTLALVIASQSVPVVFVTYEESVENLQMKSVLSSVALDLTSYRDGKGDCDALEQAFEENSTALSHLYFVQGTRELTCETIGSYMQTLMNKHGTPEGFIVLDYLQRMSRTTQGGENMRIEVAKLFAELQALSLSLKVPMLAISNVSKAAYQDSAKISLASVKEAAELEFDAYAVWALQDEVTEHPQRCPESNDVISFPKLKVLKNRDGEQHTQIRLFFNKTRGLITEASDAEESRDSTQARKQSPKKPANNRQYLPRTK